MTETAAEYAVRRRPLEALCCASATLSNGVMREPGLRFWLLKETAAAARSQVSSYVRRRAQPAGKHTCGTNGATLRPVRLVRSSEGKTKPAVACPPTALGRCSPLCSRQLWFAPVERYGAPRQRMYRFVLHSSTLRRLCSRASLTGLLNSSPRF